MAKTTFTRLVRKFDADERGVVSRRAKEIPSQNREAMPCGLCGKPMMVSAGQLAYFHRECRQQSRNRLRREAKRKV